MLLLVLPALGSGVIAASDAKVACTSASVAKASAVPSAWRTRIAPSMP